MMKHYFDTKSDKLNEEQKACINNFVLGRRKKGKVKKKVEFKKKYWCEVERDTYTATNRHIHCKLCYRTDKPDKHEVVLFDPKIHQY